MGEAAPTGWLGVGRPVGPPVPWPRDMHRALPAPGRVSSSSTSRVVQSTVVGALDAAPGARSSPAGRGQCTTFFRRGRAFFSPKAYAPNIAHLAISLREVPSVSMSQGAFLPTHRRPEGPRAQQYVPSRDPPREVEQANSAGRGCVPWLDTGWQSVIHARK